MASLLFLSLIVFFLFGVDKEYASSSFKLAHNVNVSKSYYCEFWVPGTTNKMLTKNFNQGGTYLFTTLAIYFNTRIVGVSLNVSFTDLLNTDNSSSYVPYTMVILAPDSTTELVSVTNASGGHGAGSATLLNNATLTKYDTDSEWNTDEIADFQITIDASEAPAGTYQSTITITLTGP